MIKTLLESKSNWAVAKINEVVEEFQPGFACGRRQDNGYVQLRMNNIGLEGKVVTNSLLRVPKLETNLEKYKLKKRDIIFNNTNSAELVGKTVIFNDEIENCVYSNHLTRIRVNENLILPEFLVNYLRLEQRKGTFELLCRRFVGQAAVPRESLLNLEFLLPPINEQKRIIQKIEELFKESKSARESLDKIPQIMKKFKQSVLASAFKGELVPQDPNDEPAEKLLEKIEVGRKTTKITKKIELDENDLSEIPQNWKWAPLGDLLDNLQYGTSDKASATAETGIPILRMGNIQEGKLDLSSLKYIKLETKELQKYILQKNDILINRTNSPELVGKSAMFNTDKNFVFASYLIRLTTVRNLVIPQYVNYVINSLYGRRHVEKVRHQVAGQSNINSGDIRQMPIPLSPLNEQRRIVSKIAELFSFADQIEKSVEETKKRAGRMDQAILAKAFCGELVPHDPNDEPASVLLERIKQEKEMGLKQTTVKERRRK
jgi:type I restriction enzyme, S subunit